MIMENLGCQGNVKTFRQCYFSIIYIVFINILKWLLFLDFQFLFII